MGASQPKPLRVCRDVLWSRPDTRTNFPTADQIEQCLLNTECTAALGKDVCRIIAAYCPCLLDNSFVTSHGHVIPLHTAASPSPSPSRGAMSPTVFSSQPGATNAPIRIRPRLPCPATCFTPLPPSSMAFGLADVAPLNPGETRRARVAIYNAHSFNHSHSLHFPQQSSFLTPSPSVSSLLLLSSADASTASYSSLLAGVDELGHLCVWRWTSGELLFLFDTKPTVFFSLSSLCALPNARLALLLSGCPGPQRQPSRLAVFDLSSGTAYKSAVDSDNQSDQVFPLSLYFPPLQSTPASPTPSPTRVRSSPYSLYSNDQLFRWHVHTSLHAVELHNATPHGAYHQPLSSDVWQCMGQASQHHYGYRWKYKAECVRGDRDGRLVRVEGGVGVVKVWIGHHVDRQYQGKWEFEDKGYEEAEEDGTAAEKKAAYSDEEEAEVEEEEAKRPHPHSLSSSTSVTTTSTPADDDRKAATAGLDSTDDDELPTTSASNTTTSPLSVAARTAPVLIPRVVPLPLLLPAPILFRRRHRHRRRPALLQVSAAFVQPAASPPLLVIASSAPLQHGGGGGGVGGRLVTVWRLVRDSVSGVVSGECVERRRYRDVNGEEWSVLCCDAAAKVAQRMKGPKQWLIG